MGKDSNIDTHLIQKIFAGWQDQVAFKGKVNISG